METWDKYQDDSDFECWQGNPDGKYDGKQPVDEYKETGI